MKINISSLDVFTCITNYQSKLAKVQNLYHSPLLLTQLKVKKNLYQSLLELLI